VNSFNEVVLFPCPAPGSSAISDVCASVNFTDHILLKVLLIQDTFKLELDLGIICFILGIHRGDCFCKKMFVLKIVG
jgi:hypothetical protein